MSPSPALSLTRTGNLRLLPSAPARPAAVVARVVALHGVVHVLEQIDQCLTFHDRMGRLQHTNRAGRIELEREPEPERLEHGLRQYAQVVAARRGGTQLETGAVHTRRGEYRLRGSWIEHDLFGAGPTVLITMAPPAADPCDVEHLRCRFQLTRAQARVARELALGLRNHEIAERLHLSSHTVRHHIEQIRLRLGGHTRTALAAMLLAEAR